MGIAFGQVPFNITCWILHIIDAYIFAVFNSICPKHSGCVLMIQALRALAPLLWMTLEVSASRAPFAYTHTYIHIHILYNNL